MKRFALCSSALASLCAFAATAQASDPLQLSLGGYMEYWVAGASQGDDFATPVNSFDLQGDSQIYFSGKTVLRQRPGDRHAGAGQRGLGLQRAVRATVVRLGERQLRQGNLRQVPRRGVADPQLRAGSLPPRFRPRRLGLLPDSPHRQRRTGRSTPTRSRPTTPTSSCISPRGSNGFQLGASFTPSNNTSGDDASATSETIVKDAGFDHAWATALSLRQQLLRGQGQRLGGLQLHERQRRRGHLRQRPQLPDQRSAVVPGLLPRRRLQPHGRPLGQLLRRPRRPCLGSRRRLHRGTVHGLPGLRQLLDPRRPGQLSDQRQRP